jgi:hypothetical protein
MAAFTSQWTTSTTSLSSAIGAVSRLHQVVAGRLPRDKTARKKRKPDMETLFCCRGSTTAMRCALGSGSRQPQTDPPALMAAAAAKGVVASTYGRSTSPFATSWG